MKWGSAQQTSPNHAFVFLLITFCGVLVLLSGYTEAKTPKSRFELTNLKWLTEKGIENLGRILDAEGNCTRHENNCSACLSEPTGCGYCYSPSDPASGSCHSGDHKGPDQEEQCPSNFNWTTKACPLTPAVNCSAYDGGCTGCVVNPDCGFCLSTGTCSFGTSSGPNTGNCLKNDWSYLVQECPVVEECKIQNGDCHGCAVETECGFCAASNECLPGNATGPDPITGSCASGWTYRAQECPGEDQCARFNGNCSACTEDTECGYCSSSLRCFQGSKAGPSAKEGVCPTEDWAFQTIECDGLSDVNCTIHDGDCESCTGEQKCGYCAASQKCYAGNPSGPSLPQTCPIRSWAYKSKECPEVAVNCSLYNGDCAACSVFTHCGYCSETNECLRGTKDGPAKPATCSASAWAFVNATCPKPPCSLNDGDCSGCTARPGCGFCGTDLRCVDGTEKGPSSGDQCTSNSWAFESPSCSAVQEYCSTYDFACGSCVPDPDCGYCLDDNRCYRGNSSGPLGSEKSGGCNTWLWDTPSLPECPVPPYDCTQLNGKCQQCGAQEQCGYCVSTRMCLSGSPMGPQDESDCPAGRWDYGGLTCPVVPPANCSTTDGLCVDCTSRLECGYCTANGKCLPGNKLQPSEGACPSGNWTFSSTSCSVTPFNCSQFQGNCSSCNNNPSCGYCLSTGECLLGDKTASADGSCPATGWTFAVSSCPVVPFDCGKFDQDCAGCSAADPCGYCAVDGKCLSGSKSGPSNATCPNVARNWIFESDRCSLAFNCTPFDDDCEVCTEQPACGYCTSSGECLNGNSRGPVFNSSLCDVAHWAYGECPVPSQPCVHYTSCRQCVLDPWCGYCLTAGKCVTGDEAGPTVDTCPAEGWIFNRTACPAPPAIASVVVSNDGAKIYADWDIPTNRGGLSGIFPCSSIISDVSFLGTTPTCYWQNPSRLVIRLGKDASFALGDTLAFLPGLVAGETEEGGQDDLIFLSAPISAPINSLPPVVTIEGTAVVGMCDTVLLDASHSYGSGARNWIGGYVWDVAAPSDNSSDLLAPLKDYLAQQRGAVVSFLASELLLLANRPAYNITLNLTNWLGETSTSSFLITVTREDNMKVRIYGPSRFNTRSNNPLSLRARASRPCICNIDTSLAVCSRTGVTSYAWVRSQGPVFPLDIATRTSSTLYLPPNTLTGGQAYEFTVSVTLDNSLTVIGRASVTVVVEEDSLIPRITSGDRVLSRLSNITLDGRNSSDPNSLPGAISFRWSCQRVDGQAGGACPANRYFADAQYQTGLVTLPAGVILPGEYVFTLVVTKASTSRRAILSATTSVNLIVVWEDVPTVSLTYIDESGMQPLHLPPNSRLVFVGKATSPTGSRIALSGYKWSFASSDISLASPRVASKQTNSSSLIINPNQLTPGAEYTLRLEVSYPGGGTKGSAEVSFQISGAPWGGECQVTPLSGNSATEFTVQCLGFEDDYENQPLFYHYSFVMPSGDDFFLSSHYLDKNSLTTYLPSLSTAVTVRARVTNRQGATAAASSGSAYLVVSDGIIVSDNQGTRHLLRQPEEAMLRAVQYNSTLVSGLLAAEVRAGNQENIANLLWAALYKLNTAIDAPDEQQQRMDALALISALPLEASPYAQLIKLLLYLQAASGGSSTGIVGREVTSVSPPVLSLGQRILRDLRLLVRKGQLPAPPYDAVTPLLASAANALSYLGQADSTSGQALSAEFVGFMNDIVAWQSSLAIPGTGSNLWSGSGALSLLIQRDFVETLNDPQSYEIADLGVTVELSAETGKKLAATNVDEGTFFLYAYDGNVYPWLSSNESDAISPSVLYGVLPDGGNGVGPDSLPTIDTPATLSVPVDLTALAALNVSLQDLNSRWGKECQVWNDGSLSWSAFALGSTTSLPSLSVCSSAVHPVGIVSVHVQFITLPPGPGPQPPVLEGPKVVNEENETTWLLLALVVGLAIWGVFALLLGIHFYTKRVENQEHIPPPPARLEKSLPAPVAVPLQPASRVSVTRVISLPDTEVSERSEILLRPKLANDGTHRIVYQQSSDSERRKDSFATDSDSEFRDRGDSDRSEGSQRRVSRSGRSDVSRSRPSTRSSSARKSKKSERSRSRHDTDYSSDEVTDSSEEERGKEKGEDSSY